MQAPLDISGAKWTPLTGGGMFVLQEAVSVRKVNEVLTSAVWAYTATESDSSQLFDRPGTHPPFPAESGRRRFELP
jgi:hypothetical protein